jgi:PAS domain S-box-containing protein
MRKKLTIGVMVILILIFLLIGGSQVIVQYFKATTEKLIVEFHELNALQELKLSLSKLYISVNGYSKGETGITRDDLKVTLADTMEKTAECEQVLTIYHKGFYWTELQSIILNLDKDISMLIENNHQSGIMPSEVILPEISRGIGKIEIMLDETQHEMIKYENRSRTIILHGTFTVLTFGIILILVLLIGGIVFIRNLTRPIDELVAATRQISGGDRKSRVRVESDDEFKILADSFNTMLDVLDKTTVSEESLKNIIDNLAGALFVTNHLGEIKYVNSSSLALLQYSEEEIIGKPLDILFSKESREVISGQEQAARFYRQQTIMHSSHGKEIPVMVTCTVLKKHDNKDELILVGHDLSEKKAYEDKIEQIRREIQISINEAQEEDRMRISRDIHDGLGQMLTGVFYALQGLNNCDKKDLLPIQNQLHAAIQEAKNLSHNLIPMVLKDFGLIPAIEKLIDRTNQLNETRFDFTHYDFNQRLEPRLEKAIYRICQEALNNIVKHAGATNSYFQLFKSQQSVVLVIDDNGKGFDTTTLDTGSHKSGIGLISIRERAHSFGGIFTIDSVPGKGTELFIEIPLISS